MVHTQSKVTSSDLALSDGREVYAEFTRTVTLNDDVPQQDPEWGSGLEDDDIEMATVKVGFYGEHYGVNEQMTMFDLATLDQSTQKGVRDALAQYLKDTTPEEEFDWAADRYSESDWEE
jgi:hypothetical protein